jgi:hypothetical protein
MTNYVQSCLALSVGYACVGTACLHNQLRITMLRFPEEDRLSTRDHLCPDLYMRNATR